MKRLLTVITFLGLLVIPPSLRLNAKAFDQSFVTVIFEDDFSENLEYSAKSVEYTAEDGIGNPAPSVSLRKTDGSASRLTQNVSERESGTYVSQFDFMMPEVKATGAFMEVTSKDGTDDALYLSVSDDKIYLFCFDKNGNPQRIKLTENILDNTWYTISLRINIDDKTVEAYINNHRVREEILCCLNPRVRSIGRFIDSRCGGTEYYLDNILVYKDLMAEEKLFADDFSEEKPYTAKNIVYTGMSGIGNPAPAAHLKKTAGSAPRLTQNIYPQVSSGVYVSEFDFMLPKTANCGVFMECTDRPGSIDAYSLSVTGKKMYLNAFNSAGEHVSTVICNDVMENKWYKISVTADLSNRTVRAYINNVRAAENVKCYINPNVGSIGRFIDSRCGSGEYYLDNINVYRDLVAEEIDFDDVINPTGNVELPYLSKSKLSISWKSDNTGVINNDGTFVSIPDYTVNVKLTAAIRNATVFLTRDYIVHVDGSIGQYEGVESISKEMYCNEDYELPNEVRVYKKNGEWVMLPVIWNASIDRTRFGETQIIYGNVASGTATAEARVTVFALFDICGLNFTSADNKITLRLTDGGCIDSAVIRKNTPESLEGSVIVEVVSENGSVLAKKTADLSPTEEWSEKTQKIIPLDIHITSANAENCFVRAYIIDSAGQYYSSPFIYNPDINAGKRNTLYIYTDSVLAEPGRRYNSNDGNIEGWADAMKYFTDETVSIRNLSNSMLDINKPIPVPELPESEGKNSYIILSFGHTDSLKHEVSDYPLPEVLAANIKVLAQALCGKGFIPVIVSPIITKNSYSELQTEYTEAIRKLAYCNKYAYIDFAAVFGEYFTDSDETKNFDPSQRFLTRDGAAQACALLAKEIDALETYIDSHLWYDVVYGFANYKNIEKPEFHIREVCFTDKTGNNVYTLSDADSLNSIRVELLAGNLPDAALYFALYDNGELIGAAKSAVPQNAAIPQDGVIRIPVASHIDLSKTKSSDITARAFILSQDLNPYCAAFDIDR